MNPSRIIHATIDGHAVEVPQGTTIAEAAERVQVKVPMLCKHPDLPATAACGLCIVNVEGSPRKPRACCTPLEEGMVVRTQDPALVEARRTVVELILSRHPHECLTCNRNGTCELQRIAADFNITRSDLPSLVPDAAAMPIDDSTGTIVLDPRKCITCGRCLEVCQHLQNVWALSFLDRGIGTRFAPAGDIKLAESPCILCGQCAAHCPTGAIHEFDDTQRVWDALNDPALHCVVQVAPSVRVTIGEAFGLPPGTNVTGQLYHALRRLGFAAVFDTNFGADVTIVEEAHELVERLRDNRGPFPLITSCCPSWIDYLEKFYPDLIECFSTTKSPHMIVGVLSKTYYAQRRVLDPASIYGVSVMPCTAKKYEITRDQSMRASGFADVDTVLTTRELARMIRQAGIDFAALADADPDEMLAEYSGAGTLFGVSGGVMEAALRTAHYVLSGEDLSDERIEFTPIRGLAGVREATIDIVGRSLHVAAAHGLGHVATVLDRVRGARAAGQPSPYDFIEVMACPGGCIGGGGQPYGVTDAIRQARAAGLYADDRHRTHRCSHRNPLLQQLYRDYLHHPASPRTRTLLHTHYHPRPLYQR